MKVRPAEEVLVLTLMHVLWQAFVALHHLMFPLAVFVSLLIGGIVHKQNFSSPYMSPYFLGNMLPS